MELERAKQILNGINARRFYSMGIPCEMASLEGVSLEEMLEATNEVAQHNSAQLKETGPKTLTIVPHTRLIAAVYVLEHYQPSGEAVASKPLSTTQDICVGVVRVEKEDGEGYQGDRENP